MPRSPDLSPALVGEPLLFTGHGASFAVAKAAAATLLQLGRFATAAPPDAPHPRMVQVHISRSASLPERLPPDLLVTESGSRPIPWLARMEVPAAGDPGAWVPLQWVVSAACSLREHLGLDPWRPELRRLPPLPRDGVVVLTDHASDAVQSLLGSVAAKVPELRLGATDCGELGHGPHAQLVARGGTLLRLGGALPEEVAGWLQAHAPAVRVLELPGPSDPLAMVAATAHLLQTLADATGLDLTTPRVAAEADMLRHLRRAAVTLAEVA